jgi:hypothetical protein
MNNVDQYLHLPENALALEIVKDVLKSMKFYNIIDTKVDEIKPEEFIILEDRYFINPPDNGILYGEGDFYAFIRLGRNFTEDSLNTFIKELNKEDREVHLLSGHQNEEPEWYAEYIGRVKDASKKIEEINKLNIKLLNELELESGGWELILGLDDRTFVRLKKAAEAFSFSSLEEFIIHVFQSYVKKSGQQTQKPLKMELQ